MTRWWQTFAADPRFAAARRRYSPQIAFLGARLARDNRLGLRLTLSVLLFIGATWLFGGIAEDVVTGDPLIEVDRAITRWFHAHANPVLTRWMLIVTNAHGTVAISIMGLAFGLYLWWGKHRYWFFSLAFVLPGGMLLNVLLKQVFRRDRPNFDTPLLSLATYSFPSGHVTGATLLYGLLAAFLASRLPTWGSRAAVVLCAGFLVIVVGITRIYLGVHHFSDVVAAAAWSVAWLTMWLVAVDALLPSKSISFQHPPPEIP